MHYSGFTVGIFSFLRRFECSAFLWRVKTTKAKQAGSGPSRRHIQGSKIAKGLPSVNLQYSKIEKPKNGPSGAPGPASASPWRAKEKTNLEKNLTMPKKTERGDPLGFLIIYSVAKQQNKLKGDPLGNFFSDKSLAVPKKKKGGLARYSMLRRKTGKTFWVQFARPNSAIWCNNIL